MGSSAWSLLLTGPVQDPLAWEEAVQFAGWECHRHPLLERCTLPIGNPPPAVPDWIAVTSAGAIPTLIEAKQSGNEWCKAPIGVVGERSAKALVQAGFQPALVAPSENAASLAETFHKNAPSGARVLWLRGERARDFGDQMRSRAFHVEERVVYSTKPSAHGSPPVTDAVFFAAPQAVEVWCGESHEFRPAALAIGWTTLDALLANQEQFSLTLPLATPAPTSLTLALNALATNE